jgi:hypothetical protein
MNLNQSTPKPYSTPKLETHQTYIALTGVSLPIGTTGFENPIEMTDFLEEQQ